MPLGPKLREFLPKPLYDLRMQLGYIFCLTGIIDKVI